MTIKEAIHTYKLKQNDKSLVTLLETLITNQVFIPEFEDKQPDILSDQDGQTFFPVFSSEEESKDEYIDIQWKQSPFLQCLKEVVALENCDAIVINPFTDNIRLPKEIVEGLHEQFNTVLI